MNTDSVRSLRILLVENHADTRTTMTILLRTLGHEVRSAASLAQALQACAESMPEVLLSDIGLPDGDGWGLLAQLPEATRPYAIAMSGYGMSADRERSVVAGYRLHMVKPLALEALEDALANAVRELDARTQG